MTEIKIVDLKEVSAKLDSLIIILEKKKVLSKKDLKKLQEHATVIEKMTLGN
jgi:hypothetical protein